MPYKKGGGGEQQLYNKNNGEYERNSQCIEDEKHLVFSKLFGIDTNVPIKYPIYGIHDMDYCDLVIKYCLDLKYPIVEDKKITDYILIYKNHNDKMKIFNQLGYYLSNYKELIEQIINGTNFSKKKVSRFQERCFTFKAETKIHNKNNNEYFLCTTIWQVENDFKVRFVTVIPEEYKNDN